ncbi:MAG: hypothetical protein Q4A06_00080 [Cardiobacteriaceae bacterium]|nr:hypothetical protein [Cardiobacteriaceae bacterium]
MDAFLGKSQKCGILPPHLPTCHNGDRQANMPYPPIITYKNNKNNDFLPSRSASCEKKRA